MLDSFRRWFADRYGPKPWPTVAGWAQSLGCSFRAKAEGDGFIVESRDVVDAWRIEWGASQRPYIDGYELRIRASLVGGDPAHLLVISRRLMQRLDAEIFQQFTEDLQTRADTATPDEMRWLVLYPKLSSAHLGPLRDAFGATGHPTAAVVSWLSGGFGVALAAAARDWLAPDDALVIAVQRGRVTLRTPMPQPDVARIEALLGLFRAACREARPVLDHLRDENRPPSTQPGLWTRAGDTGLPPA